ncbi:hypothetical protein [Saccharibacillus kuerlensis]|uniref:Uncharacterized protein n=1 Tax=Saccharibacillus kuerlensis TaxID=459527 RepID=A0ABQ2KVE8_9BACL|nr:hypothetical protein [Saccharibacillus kuerlensis]GGN93873.1 hypothetical protein GCM10010969_08090 [Saccharibacillus kuerlensis]
MSSIQGRTSPISSINGLPALNSSYTPSRHGKAPLENRKVSLEAELSRVLQLPASVPDREQRAIRLRRHIALLERHIALLDAANGERPEFTVQGRPDRDVFESEQEEQPTFSLPEETEEESAPEPTPARQASPRGGDDYARAMLGALESPGSLYAAPVAPGTIQPWENRSEPAKSVKVGRNFDVSV